MMLDGHPCFICGSTVLGLAGQDTKLDTFLLRPGEQDDEVLANDAYGPCHLSCLIGSRWASFWAERTVQNLTFVRKLGALHRSDDLNVFRNRAIAETVAIRSNGWMASFADDALKTAEEVPEGLLVSVSTPAMLDVAADPALHEEIAAALAANRSFPLFEYVSRLGLADRLWFPDAIRRGRIDPGTADDVTTTAVSGTAGYLGVQLNYYKLLPADIASIVFRAAG